MAVACSELAGALATSLKVIDMISYRIAVDAITLGTETLKIKTFLQGNNMLLANITMICMTGPIIHKVKDVKVLKDAVVKQSGMITRINEILGCDSRDKFKVRWDERQALLATGVDPSSLPPLKQI